MTVKQAHILIALSLLFIFIAVPTAAQDELCDIDVSSALRLLLDAQSSAIGGAKAEALSSIAQAQRALLDIQTSCGVVAHDVPQTALSPFALTETYTAPNLYFQFDLPLAWTIDSFQGFDGLGIVAFSQSGESAESALTGGVFRLLVGTPDAVIANIGNAPSADLQGIASLFTGSLSSSNTSSARTAIGLNERYELDRRDAYRVGFSTASQSNTLPGSGIVIVIQLHDGERIAILYGTAQAGAEFDLLHLAESIAVSVR